MYLTIPQLSSALSIRDLTDPAQGPHAMQELLDGVIGRLTQLWDIPATTHHPPDHGPGGHGGQL